MAEGRVEYALKDALEAVKLEPRNADGQFLLGTVQEGRRDLDAAAKAFGEVLSINPRAAQAQSRLAMLELQRRSLPSAEQFEQQSATLQPGNPGAQLVLARFPLARGDLDRSSAITAGLLQAAPREAHVQNQAGMLALAKGDRAPARAACEKAFALHSRLTERPAALVPWTSRRRNPRKPGLWLSGGCRNPPTRAGRSVWRGGRGP
jgi:tetratricopeptide (TPR) repeat protein